jgi:hypothetical protein
MLSLLLWQLADLASLLLLLLLLLLNQQHFGLCSTAAVASCTQKLRL